LLRRAVVWGWRRHVEVFIQAYFLFFQELEVESELEGNK
jgi:hypothetical protein